MAKRISDFQKKEIIQSFIQGNSIEEIAKHFDFTKLTISRNLKKSLGEEKYKAIVKASKLGLASDNKNDSNNNFKDYSNASSSDNFVENDLDMQFEEDMALKFEFVEIKPINDFFDEQQKDISSISINSIEFPKILYLIITNKFELQIKRIKDYPEWQFLPLEDLERNSIEVFDTSKTAKLLCNKDQKVIKVPNTDVFKIVAPILINKGISRIINNEKLIAL